MAFLHATIKDAAKVDVSMGYKQIDLDKLVQPKKYNGAWEHPERFQCKNWREAIGVQDQVQ
jgi:hypothetical protein